MNEPLVFMEHIEKAFPGVKALSDCRFELLKGEIHGLVGENGAGKSTMMKILTGIYKKDNGVIRIKGREVDFSGPKEAQCFGISIIHQELNLMPHLTAAQNIFIGREQSVGKQRFFISDNAINRETNKLFERLNIPLGPCTVVGGLTVAKQQMIEIAKAISFDSDILIMDEPSAALTDLEIEELFKVIQKLAARGVGVIYISHRLEELKKITSRVTVMRDGKYVDTVDTEKVLLDDIIKMMVGREIYVDAQLTAKQGDVVLEAKGLRKGRIVKDVSFKVMRNEILGIAGLVGAGRTETARIIFGADKSDAGEIYVDGKKIEIHSPSDGVRAGIGYLSEDRKRYGLALHQNIEVNLTLADMDHFVKGNIFLDKKKSFHISEEYIQKLKIKTPGLWQMARNLSGGNQQKLVIGKWLIRDSQVLIFDEPTRGIDVGAKGEIYRLLNELARQGKAIIMISSDLPEILRMSHRVIVMCEGRITGELSGKEISQEAIMRLATKRD
ncbi:MAG: sugar ABC transporter ATP-binding protein [Treponema sp.]|jgi:ribose transport system ATP-binding protein|nr:sugar ABC transporter ATP-binding protein [Treponema sp.]